MGGPRSAIRRAAVMKTAGFVSVSLAEASQERSPPTDGRDHGGARPPCWPVAATLGWLGRASP